jgi:predicted phosphodiesterase
MKIIALGDTHGRTMWKDIVAKESDADKIVFNGDLSDISPYLFIWNNIKYIV